MDTQSDEATGSVWTIVLAAGEARRFGALKQFADLNGQRPVDRVVDVASAVSDGVVVVVPEDVKSLAVDTDALVCGARTRSGSVRAGLSALPRDVGIVAIHDAAHPLASAELLQAVIDAVRAGADAAVPGLPAVEALRTVDDGWMREDIDRSRVVLVQMPQAFEAQILRRVHAHAPEAVEDSLLVCRSGGRVRVVPGDPTNVHVTTRRDLDLARVIAGAGRS